MNRESTGTPQPTSHDALRDEPAASSASPSGRTIECEIRTSAPPEHAWAAWADPEKLAHWFVDRAWGEVRPGGVMTWVFEKFNYEIPYPVLEVAPPERLVFGGEIPGFPPFRLEITIRREGGETVVRLFNSGFRTGVEWEDEYQGVASGWRLSLALLRYYLEHHYGTPKRSVLVMHPAPFEFSDIVRWFTDEARLSRWLTRSGAIGPPGTPARLTLATGDELRGTVLDVTRQEAAVSWDDAGIALELKAFTMGPGARMVGARATGWGVGEERMRALESELDRAVRTLAAELERSAAAQV